MAQVTGQDMVSMKCNNRMFDTQLVFLNEEMAKRAYSEAFAKAQQMDKQPGLLERTGRVGDAFRVLLALGSTMAELDPTGGAKVAFSICTKAWECLETQERQDANLNELIENIAGMIPSVESVRGLADADLRRTVVAMLNLIEDVSLFILSFKSRGSFERAFRSAFNPTAQEQMEVFVSRFRRLRREFDTRVGVQALRAAEIERTQAKLKELKPVDLASYDPLRQCISGTRIDIVGKLSSWAQKLDTGPRLAWVHGLAGLGKSSIATSVCIQLDSQEMLASSFFCKRDNPELRDPRRVLTTIVCGLASRWEPYRDAVVAVIRDDVELPSKHIQPLYDALVTKPLQTIAGEKPPANSLVILIDALDECGDTVTRRQLLACLRDMSQQVPSLKIIATSRPDADIQEFFAGDDTSWLVGYDLLEYDASDDIQIFVQDRLSGLPHIKDWPEDAVERISRRSSGLFIWARTACKFIVDGYDRRKRLEQVLTGTRLADIDALYTTAIEASVPDAGGDNMQDMLGCLGAVVVTATRTPLSAINLAAILRGHISLDVLERVLASLSSVLYVDEKLGNIIRIFHPSFMDYITTRSRSKHLCVDLEHQNTILAESCFQVMASDLRFNICGLETSDLFNNDIPGLDARVRNAIRPHLGYSCSHWSGHVSQARLGALGGSLRRFLFGRELLYWLEVLSLLGKLNVAPTSLLEFLACSSSESMQDCRILAHDAYRFVLLFYDAISRSTPHLYISALAIAPVNSEISRRMRGFFSNLLTVTQGEEKEWARCLRIIWVPGIVNCVAFSPDSRRIVSADDTAARIWDAETGDAVLEPVKGHTGWVVSVAFSPNGRWIVSSSDDKTIRVWDAETGELRLGPLQGSGDHTVRLWDAGTGQPVLKPLHGHTDPVWSVAFSPDNRWIASGSWDSTLRIWDSQTGFATHKLVGHSDCVFSVAFSPDSRRIASCSGDHTIRIWNTEIGEAALQPLQGHSAGVQSIAFSPNGLHLVSGSNDATVRIWDAQTGDELDTLDGHSAPVLSVAFSADDRRVVSGSSDKTIRTWDVTDGGILGAVKNRITPKGHSARVFSVGFSSNSRYVASGSYDKTVRIWDAETGAVALKPLEGHTGEVLSVAFSPDDSRVVSGSRDETVRIWNAETGETMLEPLRGHSGPVRSVMFSPNGHRIASGSEDRTVRVWDVATGAPTLLPLAGHSDFVRSVAFSPNGSRLVSGSNDRTIRIWDAEVGRLTLKPLIGHADWVMSVAFSPDGRRIVSGSKDSTIRVWDAETGGAIFAPIRGHAGWVRSVAFSSDGRWVVSGSEDVTVRIWNATTGEAICEPMLGHSNHVLSIALSADGRRIVSGSMDSTVRIWDMEAHIRSTTHAPEFLPGTQLRILPPHAGGGELLVTSTQLHRHMRPDSAGWLTSNEGELLLWLPPDLRRTDDSLICISPRFVRRRVVIDFSSFVHGSSWTSICDG
ncbi:hypothetical protein FS749_004409 [Ceratobasidium sp. UAMH 11750]|nr:hypothetical protein FS749_004409 [Ceratobasidium sp. UAMH 11750]